MAEISPKELKFRFQLGKTLPAAITIHNPTEQRLAFKVKTTTPKKYVVRPSSGVVEPRTTATVQVIMQASKEYPADMAACKDKFLVQTEVLPPGESVTAETFASAVGTKLKVVLEGPPAPPSPVPEVNEADDDSKSDRVDASAGARGSLSAAAAAADDPEAQNRQLRKQLEQMRDERDQLKRQLDTRGRSAGGATKSSSMPIIPIFLAAILAFVVGHYLKELQALAHVFLSKA